MTTVDEQLDALQRGVGLVVLDRDVLAVRGPEAERFLQGQLSQDVAAMVPGTGAPSFVLEPNGKVTAWLRVTRAAADEFLLDVDAGFGDVVAQRLNRFKLRTKCDIEAVDGWTCAVQPIGPESESAEADPGAGFRYRLDHGVHYVSPAPFDPTRLVPVGAEAYEAWRIAHGIPVMGRELVPTATIPGEAGAPVIDSSVSFTKGCYTGQELVARIDSRGGNVPHPVRLLVIDAAADAVPPAGAEVVMDDKVVGSLTSVAWSPREGAAIALAPLARSVEVGAAVAVRRAGGETPARVAAPPLGTT